MASTTSPPPPTLDPYPPSPTLQPQPQPQPEPQHEPEPEIDPPMATPLPILIPAPPPSSSSSRRLPPPCWTPEETSALIDAYRDKWYSLRRGNLRAFHWQEVADDVHNRCPEASPPKTAVQCRHKMEKLRKRYRAELNRAKSIPHHRFSSSWVYFPRMDSMEKGPNGGNSVSTSSPPVATVVVAASEDVNDAEGNDVDEDGDDEDNVGGGGGGGGYGFRNFDPRRDFNRDYQRNGLRIKIAGNSGSPYPNPNPSYGYKSKFANINNFSSPPPPQFEDAVRYTTRVGKNGSNGSAGSSGLNMNMNTMMKMKKKKTGSEKRERESSGDEAAMEMVEAIRMMGEGFVRMEKMKMEMMRETERMRMEMEMKRTEMILESQHRIVETFAKGLSDTMKMKKDASC